MTDHAVIAETTVRWASRTDVGKVRSLNEDAVLTQPPLFLVADGMGGHDAGEVASALTASRLHRLVEQTPTDPASIEELSAEIQGVNADLFAASDHGQTMGTTLTGLAIADYSGLPAWLAFNVGDSRVYSWFEGQFLQVTKDHSYVQELVDSGQLNPEDARTHHQRNVITRALGADAEVAADFWVRPIRCDEWFVICSDGLTGEVDDERITEVLSRATEPDQVADELLTLALDHGGKDNVTVIVLHVTGVGDTIEITTETRDRVAPDDPSGASLIQMVPVGIAAAATSPERPMVRLIEELPAMLRQPDIDEAPEAAPDSSDAPPPTLIEAMPTELAHADPEATTGVNDEPT